MTETAYQRANRLAEEAKARTRAAATDAWKRTDWAEMLRMAYSDVLRRPIEIEVFENLYEASGQKARDQEQAALQMWRRVSEDILTHLQDAHDPLTTAERMRLIEQEEKQLSRARQAKRLREIHKAQGVVLTWEFGSPPVLLEADESDAA